MSSELPCPPPGFDRLSTDEQIEYVEDLWDYIASRPNEIPVPEWHLELLEERLARYGPHFTDGISWEELEQKLMKELREKARD